MTADSATGGRRRCCKTVESLHCHDCHALSGVVKRFVHCTKDLAGVLQGWPTCPDFSSPARPGHITL
jgi:hypothetical protein